MMNEISASFTEFKNSNQLVNLIIYKHKTTNVNTPRGIFEEVFDVVVGGNVDVVG